MKSTIRYAMKFLASILMLVPLTVFTAHCQPAQGTLKIFSENPLVVYVDEVHYPQYGEIRLVPGTHWVKAINAEGVKVYSQIVTLKAGEVTSVLIEVPKAQPTAPVAPVTQAGQSQSTPPQAPAKQVPAGQGAVTYGQAPPVPDNSSPGPGNPATETPAPPVQSIDIGQIAGRLPADMSGAFGLSFGMSMKETDQFLAPKAAQVQRNTGYYVYAIPYQSSFYLVECRFLDQKLFQIIVGYVSTYNTNTKVKLDKKEVPFPEYNRMLTDLTAIYGDPDSTEKIFMGGYTEDDGRILEALKKKKALIYHTWTEEATGNNVIMGLAYTTSPLAAAIYTSGPMSAEAAARKIKLHGYDYKKSFKDNYFSN
jgi:hypothetical protein